MDAATRGSAGLENSRPKTTPRASGFDSAARGGLDARGDARSLASAEGRNLLITRLPDHVGWGLYLVFSVHMSSRLEMQGL